MWIYKIGLSILLMPFYTNGHDPGYHSYAPDHEEYISHETPTDYNFSYGVKDYHSGDVKHHWEKKDGDKVTGQYSLLESDGTVRTVDYTADKAHGFNAVVKHSGHSRHPVAAKEEHPLSQNEVVLKPAHQAQVPYNHKPEYTKEPQYEWKYIYPDEEGYEEALAASKLEEDSSGGYPEEAHQNYWELAQESQRSTVASKYNGVKEEKAKPQLPVDLSFLKPDSERIVPVDVSLVKPIEVSVKDTVVQPSHELSQEELARFLREYYKTNTPQLEQGFQPIRNTVKAPTPLIPGTFDSKKKPVTTPGLSTFSSKKQTQLRSRGSPSRKSPKLKSNLQRQHYRYFTPINEEVRQQSRLYRSVSNGGYVRYGEEVAQRQ